ncbi:hypothetical protein Tco_0595764 [Tanacetum coccineum]
MALSPLYFRKRYKSSYETPSPSASLASSPTLPIRKRYRGTSELIFDTETEDDESGAEGARSRSEESEDEGLGSEGGEAVSEEQQQHASPRIEVLGRAQPSGEDETPKIPTTLPQLSPVTTPSATIAEELDEFITSKANDIGKDFPNPFMAGSLPKTIKQSNNPPLSRGYTLESGDDSLELMELMENCTQIVCFVRKKNREICTTKEGLQAIFTTIDGHEKLITEASLRRHLKLEDAKGISSLSNEEIFKQLAHMGYVTNFESLTFFKGHFSLPWKFFIHTILHCLSSKKTACDQFSSNIATTIICLAISRRFNFSKFIFEAMIKNLDSPHKLLLYPMFIQLLLNKQQRLLPYTRTYPTPTLISKLFSNTRRASKGYSGVVTPLFESMLVQEHDEEQQQSSLRITSSPSLSPQPTQPSPLLELL